MAYLTRLILFAKEIVGLTHKHYISWVYLFQDFSAMQQQMLTQMHQTGAVQNNARVQYSGTNTDLNLLSFGVNMPETHLNFGMDLNVSSGHAICTKVRKNVTGSSTLVASVMMLE